MLKIHGASDGSNEEIYARKIASMARAAMPDIDTNDSIRLDIIPSAQMFSCKTRDVDILLIFADYRETGCYVTSGGRPIHSFITTVELKNHAPTGIWFEGESCYVKYGDREHSATAQSEDQKFSVRKYIGRKLGCNKNKYFKMPFITNLIWLPLLPKNKLPPHSGNVVADKASWHEFLEVLGSSTSHNYNRISTLPESGNTKNLNRELLVRIVELFTEKIEFSDLDLKRFEKVTHEFINNSKKQYIEKLGTQLLIFKGRGGSGKTARLINLALSLYREMNQRVVILTYNNALVSDITRQLKHFKVNNEVGGAGLSINTIHSFMGAWLNSFKGTLDDTEALKDIKGDFFQTYEPKKQMLSEYLTAGAITKEDVVKVKSENSTDLDWDYVMIDESQDWPETERNLIYQLYGPERVIIADGVDQLVRSADKINWRPRNLGVPSQVVLLTKSLRLKSSLCIAIREFAEQIEYDWQLEEVTEAHGGRVVLVLGNALDDKFQDWLKQEVETYKVKPLDVLSCVPPSWVKRNSQGSKYCVLAKKLEERGELTWDGTNENLRLDCATKLDQFRIVQYESCRGLEGWFSVNYALDEFFEYKKSNPDIPESERFELFFDEKEYAEYYAKKWILIPLTRAVDTLVIHIKNPESYLGKALLEMQSNHPDVVSRVDI